MLLACESIRSLNGPSRLNCTLYVYDEILALFHTKCLLCRKAVTNMLYIEYKGAKDDLFFSFCQTKNISKALIDLMKYFHQVLVECKPVWTLIEC